MGRRSEQCSMAARKRILFLGGAGLQFAGDRRRCGTCTARLFPAPSAQVLLCKTPVSQIQIKNGQLIREILRGQPLSISYR